MSVALLFLLPSLKNKVSRPTILPTFPPSLPPDSELLHAYDCDLLLGTEHVCSC